MRLVNALCSLRIFIFQLILLCLSVVATAQEIDTTTSPEEDTLLSAATNGVSLVKMAEKFSGSTINEVPLQYVQRQPFISVQQMLKGNAAGVYVQETSGEPGTEQNIFIRGISTPLLSKRELFDQQPTIYVNGIPLTQDNPFAYEIQKYDFNRIGPATNLLAAYNQDNIESIEVIKDPVTLASLGSMAANGAIWITTKNAKSGFREISINSYFGYAAKLRFTQPMRLMKMVSDSLFITNMEL
ncbi:TonB-dependent receptor plug domain-containing protein [Niabella ginsengisoli]|uniref:TonB-dependent receptor plug domain-containing protein n=1 Tax=Niabella ginsengisoli TaxID=522298 RepID=A0ABS9SFY6_9BACT|nr:TonB-dependent receptor plug domain-containing protein [Niabella ginsengisoli]MCH5597282.1 TonB-dependent receptor plug domain-containing protein [Niabella ginsengisoli]